MSILVVCIDCIDERIVCLVVPGEVKGVEVVERDAGDLEVANEVMGVEVAGDSEDSSEVVRVEVIGVDADDLEDLSEVMGVVAGEEVV